MVDQRASRRGRTEAPQAAELEPRCEEEKAVDIAGNYSLDVFSARSSFRRFASLRACSVADWARRGATLLTRYFHLVGLWLVGGFSARLFFVWGGTSTEVVRYFSSGWRGWPGHVRPAPAL